MANGRADGLGDGDGIQTAKANSLRDMIADVFITTTEGNVLAVKVLDGEITGPAEATEVAGGTVRQDASVVAYADKRYIAFGWAADADGIATIDSVDYPLNGMADLPIYPLLARSEKHRSISVDMSAGSGLIINFLNA